MNKTPKILFPTDFTEFAEKSFSTALFLAKAYKAELFLMHSIEEPGGVAKLFSGFDEEKARKHTSKMLDKMIKQHKDEDIHFEKFIKVEKPYKAIVEAANEITADLIVMGTHGLSGIENYFVGSNASRVIRTAPCPVLTVRDEPGKAGFNKILLPLDLSKETSEKVKWGIDLANQFDSELYLMTVLTSDDEEEHLRLKKRLSQAAAFVDGKGIKVHSSMVVSKENVAEAVNEYANQIDADLICIMTQQELSLKEAVLGSNAAWLVNNSSRPVMSIKPVKHYKEKSYSSALFS